MSQFLGKKVEEFKAPVYQAGKFTEVTNKDLEGKWSIFFFYPGDFTFVCPTELEDLANNYEAFQKTGTEIYSVSTDSEYVHKAWQDASDRIKKINYPMVSDRNFKLSNFFDFLIPEDGMAHRGTVIINPEGEIVLYEICPGGVGRSAKELLRKLRACQFVAKHGDQVCPANWDEGAETLKPGIDLVGKL